MKFFKPLLTVLLLLFSLTLIHAQNMRFSYVANPTLNWMSPTDNDSDSDGTVMGYRTGLVTDFFFADKYAFSTGIIICQTGGKLIFADTIDLETEDEDILLPSGTSLRYRLQYVGIPLGLKFKTIEIGYSTFWLNVGLTPMININAYGFTRDDLLDKANMKEEIGMLNTDFFIKAGIEYSLGGETALIGGLGYNSGFVDVTRRTSNSVSTRSLSLVIGILF